MRFSPRAGDATIALFTVTFCHLHYNVFEHGCEAISGNFALLARNCLTSTFKNIVMQMRKVNCEKGYWFTTSCVAMVTVPSPIKHIKIQSSLVEFAPCQFWLPN